MVKEYPIAHEPDGPQGQTGAFRVCEKTLALYVFTNDGTLRCIGFDGAKRWQMKVAGFRGYMWGGAQGGLGVDDGGVVYTIESYGDTIRKFTPDGRPAGEIALQMGDRKPVMSVSPITDMRLRGKLIIVKRTHPTELFQCYNVDGPTATPSRTGISRSRRTRSPGSTGGLSSRGRPAGRKRSPSP